MFILCGLLKIVNHRAPPLYITESKHAFFQASWFLTLMSKLISCVRVIQWGIQESKKQVRIRDKCNKLTINRADEDKYDHEKDEPITQYTWNHIQKVTTLALTFSVGPQSVQCDTQTKIISKQFDEGPPLFYYWCISCQKALTILMKSPKAALGCSLLILSSSNRSRSLN